MLATSYYSQNYSRIIIASLTRFQCSTCCFSSACTQEYKQSLLCEQRNSTWMVSRPPNARANRQSREGDFALKGKRQTFELNFIFYVSFADEVAVWLQIHAAEASLSIRFAKFDAVFDRRAVL